MKVVAVVPARAGSKGVPGKNKLVVGGKPLVGHIVSTARSVDTIDRLIISTEDPEIASIAEAYGAEVLYMRPSELAEDHVSIVDVMVHAVSELKRLGEEFDAVLSLQPTAPLLKKKTIEAALNIWRHTGCDSVFTVREVEHNHPYRVQSIDEEARVSPLFANGQSFLQRQDLPKFYSNSGGLYLRNRKLLENWGGKDFCL
ncbi:MAG: acylneuraminate cytidylyltransferase family protein, partial [Thalassospira sp.]|uniref:acylneuraminate cytidylyltransferase family protein n=1 Tax=Thalassospira sp. TaxID=1912094 RepID=UPI0032EF4D2A